MNENGRVFKTTAFGGFNKSDVLAFIQQTTDEKNKEIEELLNENEILKCEKQEAKEAAKKLKDDNIKLQEKNAEILERLGKMTVEKQKSQGTHSEQDVIAQLKEDHAATEDTIADLNQQILNLQNKLKEAGEEISRLNDEKNNVLEKMKENENASKEFRLAKERLADIELAAYQRSQDLEDRALEDARNIRLQSAQLITDIKNRMMEACDRYDSFMQEAEIKSSQIRTFSQAILEGMNRVANSLDEVVVGELSKNTPEDMKEERAELTDVRADFQAATETEE